MNTYLLRLCSYHQPRRERVIENVLANRQTVATLFWAQQYGILTWLGARRRLSRAQFDQEVAALIGAGLLERVGADEIKLTAAGVSYEESQPSPYQPHFYPWYWLANTQTVQRRLLLGFQVVSELAYHNRYYAPLAVPFTDQEAVRGWFRHFKSAQFVQEVYAELHLLAGALANEDQRLAAALVNRLIGHDQAGWTLNQLADRLQLSLADALVLDHDLWLAVTAFSRRTTGPLASLLRPLIAPTPISRSCQTTVQLARQGLELVRIAERRRLKLGTVREHLLTAAILTPQQLNWAQLLPAEQRKFLDHHFRGDAIHWRFQGWSGDENSDFYYFRLYQIYKEYSQNES